MLSYATIDEAWAASSPPPSVRTGDPLFDTGKDGPLLQDRNFCAPLGDAAGSAPDALESAYPAAIYDRMYGSRDTSTLHQHQPRDSADSVPQDDPRHMYGREGIAAKGPPETARTHRNDSGALFDVLLFTLFGILLILVMNEFVSVGEAIGRMRAAAASSAIVTSAF